MVTIMDAYYPNSEGWQSSARRWGGRSDDVVLCDRTSWHRSRSAYDRSGRGVGRAQSSARRRRVERENASLLLLQYEDEGASPLRHRRRVDVLRVRDGDAGAEARDEGAIFCEG